MQHRSTPVATLLAVALLSSGATVLGACGGEAQVAPPPPAPAPPPVPPPPAPPPPPPKQTKTFKAPGLRLTVNDKGEVEIPKPVLFETSTATLRPESDEVLDAVRNYLQKKPEVTKLRVEGHTDSEGDNKSNMNLSRSRAMAVSQWLVAKGIDCRRLVPVGLGEERPIVKPETSPEDKAKNRRVVFANASINGKDLGPLDGGPPAQSAGDPCK